LKRILVVQLYRIGDVLQSFPVFKGLRAEFPDARLDLLTDPMVAEAAALCPDIDQVLRFPRPSLRRMLLKEGDALQALYLSAAAIERLHSEDYDLVVNLHQDVLGQRIAGALENPATLGPVIPPEGGQRLLGTGAAALVKAVEDRKNHRKNLVDHFLEIAGLESCGRGRIHIPRTARLKAAELLESRLPGNGPIVTIQAGTSRAFRGLQASWIEAVQHRIPWARYAWIGSEAERAGIEANLKAGLKGACFAGETGLSEAAAVVGASNLVLSGDTAAIHFAALLDVPSVSAFFGTAQPFETGPYGTGHLCVYDPPACAPCRLMNGCEKPACKTAFDQVLLAEACASVLEGSPPPEGAWMSVLLPEGLAWEQAPARGMTAYAEI
jgi:heptosyltransferase-2